MRGFADTTRRHACAVGLLLVVALAACGNGKENAAAGPTSTTAAPAVTATAAAASRAAAPGRPSPGDWLAGVATDGTALYVTSHACPGQVAAGVCTVLTDPIVGVPIPRDYPLSLWSYADGRWVDRGRPGVSSRSDMKALPGGLLFVPRREDPADSGPTGPLRVSLDAGRTWADWPIPQEQRRCRTELPAKGPCSVGVAGDYVVIASNYGWIRRSIHAGGWVDITPPKRVPRSADDSGGYELLVLGGGTLIAAANNRVSDSPKGFFRVSKDFGSTWSGSHLNPGVHSNVEQVHGSVLYAACWTKDAIRDGAHTAAQCGLYRSTDLVHWRKATPAEQAALNEARPVSCRRASESVVRVGALLYGNSQVPYVEGDAEVKERPESSLFSRVRRILQRSADSCQTWQPVLGTRL
jgi:hypothetical protein